MTTEHITLYRAVRDGYISAVTFTFAQAEREAYALGPRAKVEALDFFCTSTASVAPLRVLRCVDCRTPASPVRLTDEPNEGYGRKKWCIACQKVTAHSVESEQTVPIDFRPPS